MAVKEWDGSESGNFGTADNWVGGVAPVNGDDVIINTGSRNIDDGLATGLDLASIYVGPNYTGQIGNSVTAPLVVAVTGEVTFDGGGAAHYLKADTAQIEDVRVKQIGPNLDGTLYLCGGTFAKLIQNRGIVQVHSGTVTEAELAALSSLLSTQVILKVDGGTVTTLHGIKGAVEMIKDATGTITTALLYGADLTVNDGTLANVDVCHKDVTVLWQPDTATNITQARVFAGTFNGEGSPAARTISTLERHSGSETFLDNGPKNITVTTDKDYGGTKKPA